MLGLTISTICAPRSPRNPYRWPSTPTSWRTMVIASMPPSWSHHDVSGMMHSAFAGSC